MLIIERIISWAIECYINYFYYNTNVTVEAIWWFYIVLYFMQLEFMIEFKTGMLQCNNNVIYIRIDLQA